MPAEYYLDTIKTVFQEFALVKGTWDVKSQHVRPQDIKTTALLTDRGRARRHLGRRTDRTRPTICVPSIPAAIEAFPLRRGRRGALRHLLGPTLAREGIPARCATSSRRRVTTSPAPRAAAQARAFGKTARQRSESRRTGKAIAAKPSRAVKARHGEGADVPPTRRCSRHSKLAASTHSTRRAAADAMHALWLRRLPDATPSRDGDAGDAADQPLPAGRRRGGAPGLSRISGAGGAAARPHGLRHAKRRAQLAFIDENWPASAARSACKPARSMPSSARLEAYAHGDQFEHCTGCDLCIPCLPGRLHLAGERRPATAPAGMRGTPTQAETSRQRYDARRARLAAPGSFKPLMSTWRLMATATRQRPSSAIADATPMATPSMKISRDAAPRSRRLLRALALAARRDRPSRHCHARER